MHLANDQMSCLTFVPLTTYTARRFFLPGRSAAPPHAPCFQILQQLTDVRTELPRALKIRCPFVQADMDADDDTERFTWLVAAAAHARGGTPLKAAAQGQAQDKHATVCRFVKRTLIFRAQACPTPCGA